MKVKIEKTLVLGPGETIEISNELYEKIKQSVSKIRDKPEKPTKAFSNKIKGDNNE